LRVRVRAPRSVNWPLLALPRRFVSISVWSFLAVSGRFVSQKKKRRL
jgi:hypothetical protein